MHDGRTDDTDLRLTVTTQLVTLGGRLDNMADQSRDLVDRETRPTG